MIIDCPYIKCFLRLEFVHDLKSHHGLFEECYIFAVTGIMNRPLLFTAHLESGAVFSRLPIHAFCFVESAPIRTIEELMPWGCVGNSIQIIQHAYLKNYEVETSIGPGRYLFTVDQFGGGFTEDPEQHKTMNVVELYDGNLAAMPNNKCRFFDTHFTVKKESTYTRQTSFWVTG